MKHHFGILITIVLFGALSAIETSTPPVGQKDLPIPTLEARMGYPFKDHGVLQHGIRLPVWGTSLPEAKVTVTFDGQSKKTVADKDGKWKVELDAMDAMPLKTVHDIIVGKTMSIVCEKDEHLAEKTIKDLVMGDVWLCAGQSNMAGSIRMPIHPKNYPPQSILEAHYPALRLLTPESWLICSPDTAVHYSRVAFYFIREVQKEVLIPMGIIVKAVGGSNIESWLNQPPYSIGNNYQNLVEPVVGYGIRGAIWYQGESNESDRRDYQPKLESLITGWRKVWRQGDFPFHFVQLPGINKSTKDDPRGGDGRAEIRQAYFETLKLNNTGMAVTIDIGTPGEHPPNKFDTGIRLARSVLQQVYGLKGISSCPLYHSHHIEGKTIRIKFTNAESGLILAKKSADLPDAFLPPTPVPDGRLEWLSIQDKDGKWHWAESKISGSDLLVSCEEVMEPMAVRYAYTTHPTPPLLYNKDGLPVGPFSTSGYDLNTSPRQ